MQRQISAFLQTLPLFAGVPASVTDAIPEMTGFCMREFPAETYVTQSGDTARQLGILMAGTAEVEKNVQSGSMLMNVLQKGDLTGAATLFTANAAAVNALYTRTGCTLLFFSEMLFTSLMRENWALAENYMRYLTGRVHFLTRRIESISSPSASDKLYAHVRQNAIGGVFRPQRSMSALATTLSLSRASLYRAIDELQAAGLIQCENKTIRIL